MTGNIFKSADFSPATTQRLGLVKPDGTTVTIDTNGTIHSSGVSSDVVGSSEEQTTASKAYVVGDHFIRNNAFCTVVAAISQGDTLTENTNYIRGTIAELLSYLETSVTLSTSSTTPATFTSSRITTDSCIDVGVSEWGIVPDSVSVTTGECTVTMPKVDSAKTVTVRIYVK